MAEGNAGAQDPEHVDESYAVLGPLGRAEYEALKADIADRGILVPIELDQDGTVLDGHHRMQAADELGIPWTKVPKVTRRFADDREKMRHVLALNVLRRHLSKPRRQSWIFEYEQLSFQIDPERYAKPHAIPRRHPAPSAASINTAERQRSHRLRERLRPKHPVPEGTDHWELANEILIHLERLRPVVASNAHAALDLAAAVEGVRQLAWGPE